MSIFRQTEFLTTVADLRQLPGGKLREVAFAGRSNAGKSSAINTIVGRTRLAFVSKTPGRTQHLNYFRVCEGCCFVDLPGYGYAKAPEAVRDTFAGLIGPYLQRRTELAGLVVIMDSRRPLTPLDRQLLEWFLPTGRPLHVLLSKSDKLTRQEQASTMRLVKAELAELAAGSSVQFFSSLKKSGVEEVSTVLRRWFELDTGDPETATEGKEAPVKKKAPGEGDHQGPKMPRRGQGTRSGR